MWEKLEKRKGRQLEWNKKKKRIVERKKVKWLNKPFFLQRKEYEEGRRNMRRRREIVGSKDRV